MWESINNINIILPGYLFLTLMILSCPSSMLAEKVQGQQLPQERVLKKNQRFRERATRTNAMRVLGWLLNPASTSCLRRYCFNRSRMLRSTLWFSQFEANVLITQLVFSEDLMEALEEAKAVSTLFLSFGYWLTIFQSVSSRPLKSYTIHEAEACMVKTYLLDILVLLTWYCLMSSRRIVYWLRNKKGSHFMPDYAVLSAFKTFVTCMNEIVIAGVI